MSTWIAEPPHLVTREHEVRGLALVMVEYGLTNLQVGDIQMSRWTPPPPPVAPTDRPAPDTEEAKKKPALDSLIDEDPDFERWERGGSV